jgi:hypothetical protein
MKRNEKGVKDLGTLVVSSQSRVPCLSVVFLVHDCRCVPVSVPQSSFSRESSAEYEDIRVQVCQFSGVDSVARARRSSPIFRITRPRSRSIFGQSPANILHGSSPSLARKNPGRGRVSPLVLALALALARRARASRSHYYQAPALAHAHADRSARARPTVHPSDRSPAYALTHAHVHVLWASQRSAPVSFAARARVCVCLPACVSREE